MKKIYLKFLIAKRNFVRRNLQTIGDMLLEMCLDKKNEKNFDQLYDIAVRYHWICLFIFNYQLR